MSDKPVAGYRIDAKEDGTWLIITTDTYSAMIRLEAASELHSVQRAIRRLRHHLLTSKEDTI